MSLVFPSFCSRCRKCVACRASSVSHTRTVIIFLYLLRSKFTYWIQPFSNAIERAGCSGARERQSQARVFYDDHGVVRPLQPRAEQHRDAATTERGFKKLDQQAAACRESDREEVSEPCRLWGCPADELVTYIGHILRSTTTVAFWTGGVVVGPGKIYFAIYSVCNYMRRQGWNVRIPSIPLRVECNINFWLGSA